MGFRILIPTFLFAIFILGSQVGHATRSGDCAVFPKEVAHIVFRKFVARDLLVLRLVCKEWKKVSEEIFEKKSSIKYKVLNRSWCIVYFSRLYILKELIKNLEEVDLRKFAVDKKCSKPDLHSIIFKLSSCEGTKKAALAIFTALLKEYSLGARFDKEFLSTPLPHIKFFKETHLSYFCTNEIQLGYKLLFLYVSLFNRDKEIDAVMFYVNELKLDLVMKKFFLKVLKYFLFDSSDLLHNLIKYKDRDLLYSKSIPDTLWILHCEWAERLLKRGECKKAVEQFALAIKNGGDSTPSRVRGNCGLAFLRLGKYEEAIEQFALAINKKVGDNAYCEHFNCGLAFLGLEKYEEAAEQLLKAIEKWGG